MELLFNDNMKLIKSIESLLLVGVTALVFAGSSSDSSSCNVNLYDKEGKLRCMQFEKGDSAICISGKYFLKKPQFKEWYMLKDTSSLVDTSFLKRNEGIMMIYSPMLKGIIIEDANGGKIKFSDYIVAQPQPPYLKRSEEINRLFGIPSNKKERIIPNTITKNPKYDI